MFSVQGGTETWNQPTSTQFLNVSPIQAFDGGVRIKSATLGAVEVGGSTYSGGS